MTVWIPPDANESEPLAVRAAHVDRTRIPRNDESYAVVLELNRTPTLSERQLLDREETFVIDGMMLSIKLDGRLLIMDPTNAQNVARRATALAKLLVTVSETARRNDAAWDEIDAELRKINFRDETAPRPAAKPDGTRRS